MYKDRDIRASQSEKELDEYDVYCRDVGFHLGRSFIRGINRVCGCSLAG